MAKKALKKTDQQVITAEAVQAQTFSYQEVLDESLKYFGNDELAATTWMNKYAMKNKSGEYVELSPDGMHKRMANVNVV